MTKITKQEKGWEESIALNLHSQKAQLREKIEKINIEEMTYGAFRRLVLSILK